jgi:hypothetical protein
LVQIKVTLWRCAYCKGSPVKLFFKELRPMDLAFSLKNNLSIETPLNKPLGGIWWNLAQRKITLWRCGYCKGSPVQLFFKELHILPKPYVQCTGVHITKRILFPTVERNDGSDRYASVPCTIWRCPISMLLL